MTIQGEKVESSWFWSLTRAMALQDSKCRRVSGQCRRYDEHTVNCMGQNSRAFMLYHKAVARLRFPAQLQEGRQIEGAETRSIFKQ